MLTDQLHAGGAERIAMAEGDGTELFPRKSFFLQKPTSSTEEAIETLVLSDIHLGSDNCQAKALTAFLERILKGEIHIRQLVFAGDVFDSIDFRRLKKTHWKVLSIIRHLSDKVEIIWIAGNHDGSAEIISHLLGVRVVEQYILHSGGRKILIIHGHVFDNFLEDHPFITWVADGIYYLLQMVDRTHYVARLAKASSKTFIRCSEKIRKRALVMARELGCQTVICGHTHQGIDDRSEDVHYFNTGCWTEKPAHYLTIQNGEVCLHRHMTHDVATHVSSPTVAEPTSFDPADLTLATPAA